TFAALGMIATARAGSYSFFDYYFTLGISLMVFFCGVFFPLASLPSWAQAVAWFLPLTHAVRLSRGLVAGAPSAALVGDVAWLVIVAVAGFVVAERLVRRRLILWRLSSRRVDHRPRAAPGTRMRGALLALLAVALAVPVAADTTRSEAAGLR